MKCFHLLLPILLFLWSCAPQSTSEQDSHLPFTNQNVHKGDARSNNNVDGWYVGLGDFEIEDDALYLHLSDTSKNKHMYGYYSANLREIDGKSIRFSGKYKYSGADKAIVRLGIHQYREKDGNSSIYTMSEKSCLGDSDWTDFSIETSIDDNLSSALFDFVLYSGNIKLWLKDCKVEIDNEPLVTVLERGRVIEGKDDKEFDKGSAIVLEDLSPQGIENLEILGKVWGFLKYYHPEVAKGKYNWDYELFRVLPDIASAKDKTERNRLIGKWIDKYDTIEETCNYTINDPSQYSRIINLDWLADDNLFDKALIEKLESIKNAKRSGRYNHYLIQYAGDRPNTEQGYSGIPWNDQGFRILNLFRLWNAVEYCFPYIELTDRAWRPLLKEYIPRFAEAKSKTDYEISIIELGANINDSHGNIMEDSMSDKVIPQFLPLPSADLLNTDLRRKQYRNTISASLVAAKNGEIVVYSSDTPELQQGDIILSVDGQSVEDIVEELSPYFIASNKAVLMKLVLPYLLKTDDTSIVVTIIRDGKEVSKKVSSYGQFDKTGSKHKKPKDYNLESKNIIYFDVSEQTPKGVILDIMEKNMNAKGMILDLRKYPKGDHFWSLAPLLMPQSEEFICFSANMNTTPGNFIKSTKGMIGNDNPDYFKGKIAILVDEGTLSNGEYCAMAYRNAPKSKIIGSTTAGADGNFCSFSLIGGYKINYTGLGAYYPNWDLCQRVGVKIDIEARPTPEEIRRGQDVLIERAIEYIKERE